MSAPAAGRRSCRNPRANPDAGKGCSMKTRSALIALLSMAVLGGCASVPSGPSLLALPGTGRTFDEFRASDGYCRHRASQLVSGQANDTVVRSAVVGTAVGALAGAAIGGHQGAGVGAGAGLIVGSVAGAESGRSYGYGAQRRYDDAYVQCMYASGHKVPVSASMARSMTQAPVDPALNSTIPPPPPYALPPPPPPP
jgi:hypothetical protein